MALPAVGGTHHTLPPGRHLATLAEIETAFVSGAPYSVERQLVFDAFLVWRASVKKLLPDARFWVNGGFATHKPWAAPKDVDVVVVVPPASVNALSKSDQAQLLLLLTQHNTGAGRRQPMSGLIDAFLCPDNAPDALAYWDRFWSSINGQDKTVIDNAVKGYVEVTP